MMDFGRSALTRPVIIGIVMGCAALISGGVWVATRAGTAKHNIILIVIDTTRADSLGCYGSKRGATPNLDKLAREGVRFDQAFGHAPWTLPSIASLLTSTFPTTHGALGKQWGFSKFTGVRPSIVSGAKALQDAGFTTHAIVNAVFLDKGMGLERGFDEYDIDHGTNAKIRRVDECVRLALAHMKANRGERNLLLLHLFDPHLRYDPPAGWDKAFIGNYAGPLRGMGASELHILAGRMMRGEYLPPPEDQAYLKNMHLAELAYVDAQLGAFLDGLKELKLYDRSTIVVTADHGEEFWDHGGFEHGHTLYDELIRLPLIIKPGRDSAAGDTYRIGATVNETVRQIDIMPTLLEMVSVDAPSTFEGESFHAALNSNSSIEPRSVYSEEPHYNQLGEPNEKNEPTQITNELVALREDGYKYIIDLSTGAAQLYHVAADPSETRDLVDSEPQRAASMQTAVLDFARELLERADKLGHAPPFDMHEDLYRILLNLGYVDEMPDDVSKDWQDTPKLEKIERLESEPQG